MDGGWDVVGLGGWGGREIECGMAVGGMGSRGKSRMTHSTPYVALSGVGMYMVGGYKGPPRCHGTGSHTAQDPAKAPPGSHTAQDPAKAPPGSHQDPTRILTVRPRHVSMQRNHATHASCRTRGMIACTAVACTPVPSG